MNRSSWFSTTVLFLASATFHLHAASGALDEIAARMKVPGAAAPKLSAALKPDAPPDFSKWAGPLNFGRLSGEKSGELAVKTEGFLACDATHLHIAIRSYESPMSAVPNKKVELDGNVWAADSIEMMVLPGLDPTKPYYQLALNPAGSLFDARINDKTWNSNAKTYAWRDGKSWTVAASLPYASVGAKAGEVPSLWRVNLHRWRPKRDGARDMDLSWSPTLSRSNHVPARFGLVHLAGLGKAVDKAAAFSFLDAAEKLQILFRQDFEKHVEGFSAGEVVKDESNGGFLRCKGKRKITLQRNFGAIQGLHMAIAYRTAPHQQGLVIHGAGTETRAARPGLVQVLGRGLAVARTTCQDADGKSRAYDLGFDAFRFKRPYGH